MPSLSRSSAPARFALSAPALCRTEFHCKSPSGEFPCDQLYEACLNGCSGHGTCKDGVCHCDKGFGSADCAVRVVGSASERTAAAAERGKDVESLPKGAFEAPKWLRRGRAQSHSLIPSPIPRPIRPASVVAALPSSARVF